MPNRPTGSNVQTMLPSRFSQPRLTTTKKEKQASPNQNKKTINENKLEVVSHTNSKAYRVAVQPSLDLLTWCPKLGKNSGYNWLLKLTKDHINFMFVQLTEPI